MRIQSVPLTMLGRFFDFLPTALQPIQFRIVQSVDEFSSAAHLVYREFVARGYVSPTSSQSKLSIHHALPQTTTFIAWHHRAGVIGTIVLIEDSPIGLPIDDGYKAELDVKRRKGQRIAEATMLALDSRLFPSGAFSMGHSTKLLLMLRLFKVLLNYLRSATQVDEVVACFHPKHQILFEFLKLQPLGEAKSYAGANGTTVVAHSLNLEETQRGAKSHPAYRLCYGKKPSPRAFSKKLVLQPEVLRRLFVLDSSIFASASPTELTYLMSCYPKYDFEKIFDGTTTSNMFKH